MLFADYGFEGGYGVLVKFLENFICIFIFFVLLEGLLYFKDYNELMIIDNYLRYEIKNKELMSFSNERYEVIINDNEYSLILKRDSLFEFEWCKKIEYNGIVY